MGKILRIKLARYLLPLLIIGLFLSPFCSLFQAGVLANSQDRSEGIKIYDGLTIDTEAQAVLVMETGRQKILYEKAATSKLPLTVTAKVMTALIACERLPLDTMVTISAEAAKKPDASNSPDYIILESGDKYLLEYLLLRMLYYDNDAAALAIAEQIANEEDKFVEIMNSRAAALSLDDTIFLNSSGQQVIDSNAGNEAGSLNLIYAQYSTVQDTAKLLHSSLQNQTFSSLFSRKNEQIIINGERLVPMRNEIESLWTLSEGMVSGAMLSKGKQGISVVSTGKSNDINLITVIANAPASASYTDTLSLYRAIGDFYESSPLVKSGELFADNFEKTIDGEVFGLVYSKTVNYIHPKNVDFLKSEIQYKSQGNHSRPIQRTMVVGQVIFELLDGSLIPVDVSPNRQILSTITIVDRALDQLQQNQNLTLVILLALASLILFMVISLISSIYEMVRMLILINLENKTRKT